MFVTSNIEIFGLIDVLTFRCLYVRMPLVVVHSRKGGVGKTTLAYELAWLLDGVLVDLDWEEGGATRTWGYRWEDRVRSPLLSGLEHGTAPRPLKGFNKPRLVPGHPDFEHQQPAAAVMA